jgi:hypothetical protein
MVNARSLLVLTLFTAFFTWAEPLPLGQDLSANNTSAADSFHAQDNGNAGAGNISKVSLRELLPLGAVGLIYAQYQPWFGSKDHISVGYHTDDPAQVRRQVDDMMSRGIDGVVLAWYGSLHKIEDDSSKVMMKEAERRGGRFHFAIEENSLALNKCEGGQPCSDPTQKLIDDLVYAAKTYFVSSAYLTVHNRPVVCFFDVDGNRHLDWGRVRREAPGNPLFIFRKNTGFDHPASDGAFAWRGIARGQSDMGLGDLDDFYSAAKNSGKFAIGAVYKGFDDHLASWTGHKFVDQHCGQTWLESFREVGKHFSASHPLPILQVVTWNDYEEGTEIETGVENCVSVSASLEGTTLRWKLDGNRDTVNHVSILAVLNDGQAKEVAEVSASQSSLDLLKSAAGLGAGGYRIYVEAVGQPSMTNHVSPAMSWRK